MALDLRWPTTIGKIREKFQKGASFLCQNSGNYTETSKYRTAELLVFTYDEKISLHRYPFKNNGASLESNSKKNYINQSFRKASNKSILTREKKHFGNLFQESREMLRLEISVICQG